jgi:Carboxypeptidase regulatory-like domain
MKPRASMILGISIALFTALTLVVLPPRALAQSTISTGSIQGTVSDPSGAALSGAKVTITDQATGKSESLSTNSAGVYNSGPLTPGTYKVSVTGSGFRTTTGVVTVLVGNSSTFNTRLQLGQESQTVEVQASEVQVNTEQATVQGVLTQAQIDNLPVNGRNFLDLAQLEPGVQIQDGQNFDPTKAGYSSISFGGRFGRTARIEVDGVDVSDETVGTTTEDIPEYAIQEFQISQSSLDMSSELTSSGAVNVTTKSGTNSIHGQAFGQFRDSSLGATLPVPTGFKAPYQRSQYGAGLGGPIIKDKLFFFADGERSKQDTQVPVPISAPFLKYSGTFADPFREDNLLGRLDYQLTSNVHLFSRYSYFKNVLGATFGFGYSLYDNKDITRNEVVGADFNTGGFTHQIRFAYLKFQNQIVDATTGSSLPFANIHAEIFMGSTGLTAGPNLLAPQSTPQTDHELKYDGTKVLGSHVIRYGVAYNHLQGGGFAAFFRNGPEVDSTVDTGEITGAAGGPFPGGITNPFNYPADFVLLSNGLGFSTSKPALGFPAGGLGPDNRILLYLGDTWKVKPNFALTYGLRYDRDTGRTDSQYPAIPDLNTLMSGVGNAVKQPNNNWAPQIGFAWDPMKNGRTSIRGGIGLFYENAIWNNVLFDGPLRQPTGAFLQFFPACTAPGQPEPLQTANGTINTPGSVTALGICGPSGATSFPLIGNALPFIQQLNQQFVAGNPLNLTADNPSYVGAGLTDCSTAAKNCFFPSGFSMFDPNYKSPRSVQMNIGMQHEIRHGMVLSADYVRNVQTHFLLGIDHNHTGDIRYFNKTAATQAIAAVEANCGLGGTVASTYSGNCVLDPSTGTDDNGTYGTAGNPARPATIADYAGNGLTSSADFGGSSCYAALGYGCAFGGINPLAPPLGFLTPVGRSVYNGLQTKLTTNIVDPLRGVHVLNLQIAYALSRFDNSGGGVNPDATVTASSGDQDFIVPALDQENVNHYFGPSTLDRTHQISFGGYMTLKGGLQLGLASHFYSPLSTTLTVPNTSSGAGEIFRTDFTGDGTTQDPIPGTNIGAFGRSINAGNINTVLAKYNSTVAGNPTPAGQTLVSNGFMTTADLTGLGAVAPSVPVAPPNQVNLSWLRAFDMTVGWTYKFKEHVTFRPQIGFYNLFNFANFDAPTSMLSGLLNGGSGSINGTAPPDHFVNRVGVGTGVYTLGSPRQTEFSLKIDF